jgi:hypothetical protein
MRRYHLKTIGRSRRRKVYHARRFASTTSAIAIVGVVLLCAGLLTQFSV